MRSKTDKGARMLSQWMSARNSRNGDEDPIWNEFTFEGSINIIVPRKKEEELACRLEEIERERFIFQLSSPKFQEDLYKFLKSETFQKLKDDWAEDSSEYSRGDFLNEEDDVESTTLKPLRNPGDLKAPQTTQGFLEHVKHCMSDLSDYSALHHGMIRLFTAKSTAAFVEEIGEDSERITRAWRIFVSMARNNGYRQVVKASEILECKLKALKDRFPTFAHVVDHIQGQIRVWALRPEDERRIKPILLNGPKGTGKSAFAKALAEVFETHYSYVNISSTTMNGVLTGTSNKWGNGQPGLIFSALARSDTASPVILLDEIEKCENGGSYPIEGALLALLEPQTSREFRDEYGNLEFDASRVIYIATSNESGRISAPLKSRFDEFEIAYPTKSQREVIITNMLKRSYCNTRFSSEALSLVASQDGDLRALQTLVDKVVSQHVSTVLSQMASGSTDTLNVNTDETIIKDECNKTLHGEQIIEELTVRSCLQNTGSKSKAYFGFVEL